MKKVLLGTVSALGLALVAAPASAQITVKLGGSVNFMAGYFDLESEIDSGVEASGLDFKTDSELRVTADGKADNGLLYGAEVQVEVDQQAGKNSDEVFLYVAGGWGRVELGDADGAGDQLFVYAPAVGLGQVDGEAAAFGISGIGVKPTDTSDATKVTYLTPSFGGFKAGVSYIPRSGEGQSFEPNGNIGGTYDNAYEVGAQYEGEFGGFSVAVGGSYNSLDFAGDRQASYGLGLNVGFAGFTVGGAYIADRDIDGGDFDGDGWNIGAIYEAGPFGVGASYARYEQDTAAGDAEEDLIALGVAYTVAPGLTTSADLYFATIEEGGDDNNNAGLVTSVRMAF